MEFSKNECWLTNDDSANGNSEFIVLQYNYYFSSSVELVKTQLQQKAYQWYYAWPTYVEGCLWPMTDHEE